MLERDQADEIQAQLLRRVADGDREAIAQFYDQTATPLFSIALRILGDAAEAEEVVQDVFVQIWQKANTFDPMAGSAFHWTVSITRHRAIDRLRSRQRRTHLLEQFQQTAAPEENPGPENSFTTEDGAAIRSALAELPAEQREAIEMAFFGGKTHLEIAEALGQPLGTIKARIRRGMLKLRENLGAYA